MPGKKLLEERRRAHRLAYRVSRFLKHEWTWEIRLVPLRTDARLRRRHGFSTVIVGLLMEDEEIILIDPTYEDFFGVLIHECLHAIFPSKEEEEILELESLVRRHLTPRQARSMLIWAANRIR